MRRFYTSGDRRAGSEQRVTLSVYRGSSPECVTGDAFKADAFEPKYTVRWGISVRGSGRGSTEAYGSPRKLMDTL